MALDFYRIDDLKYKEKLFAINDVELIALETILADLQKLSGVYINPYGVTKIHDNHINFIAERFKETIEKNAKCNCNKRMLEIYDYLNKYSSGLVAVGD